MKLKRKVLILVALLITCGGMSTLFNSPARAQAAEKVPISCISAPDGKECKGCLANPSDTITESCVRASPDSIPSDTGTTPPPDRLDCTGDNATDNTKCCGGVKTSIISGNLCGTNEGGLENNSVYKLLIGALNILTAAIGVAAVGGIGYGALLYTTAQSSPEQTKRAIGIITNVVVGIVAYGLMYVLLNFLIPGGIFS